MEIDGHSIDSQEEFVQLLTRNQSRIYGFIFKLLGSPGRVADVFQETNMVLWRKRLEFDFSQQFLPWAFAIARNQIRAAWQKQGRDRLQFSDETIERIEEQASEMHAEESERFNALEQCMKELPDPQRILLHKRYDEGVSIESIASTEKRTANAIAVTIHRIRQALAMCVKGKLSKLEGGAA